jgi:hypothetical protein
MKKLYFLSIIAIVSLTASVSAQNLLLNPSFEANVASVPTSWAQYSPNSTNAKAQVVAGAPGAAKDGANYLRIEGPCDVLRFQDVNIPQDGIYSLKAWVRSSGNVSYTVLYGRVAGSPDYERSLNIQTNTWTQIVINNINISVGRIQIGIQMGGGGTAAGQWIEVDNLELVASTFVAPNFVRNPGFEDNNAPVVSPSGWNKYTGAAGGSAVEFPKATVIAGTPRSGSYYGRLQGQCDVMFFQGMSGLANGTYTLKGWFRNSGPIGYARMTIKGFGGNQIETNIGLSMPDWTQVTIPNIVVSNGAAQLDVFGICGAGQYIEFDDFELTRNISLSSASVVEDDFSIFPNPVTNNVLNISYSGEDSYDITISTILGTTVFVQSNNTGSKTIDTASLTKGIYVVKVSNGKDVTVKKVIIR